MLTVQILVNTPSRSDLQTAEICMFAKTRARVHLQNKDVAKGASDLVDEIRTQFGEDLDPMFLDLDGTPTFPQYTDHLCLLVRDQYQVPYQ